MKIIKPEEIYELPNRKLWAMSPSSAKKLDTCEGLYWMERVKGVRPTIVSRGLSLLMGNYLDAYLQMKFDKETVLTEDMLLAYFDKKWEELTEIPKLPKEVYLERLHLAINDVMLWFESYVEEFLVVNKQLKVTINNLSWGSYPDFIVRHKDGRIWIIDIKYTGNAISKESGFENYRFQLETYKKQYELIYPEDEVSVISIYNVSVKDSVKPKGMSYSADIIKLDYDSPDEKYDSLFWDMNFTAYEQKAIKLHDGDLPVFNGLTNRRCSYCEFTNICPAKSFKDREEEIEIKAEFVPGQKGSDDSDNWRIKEFLEAQNEEVEEMSLLDALKKLKKGKKDK